MIELGYSKTLIAADRMREMAEQGLEIVNFTGGTLDDTPALVKDATKQAIDEGFGSGLTDSSGLPALREAIGERLSSDEGICVDPKREIIITVGAKNAIYMALQATLDAGDEVLILDPFWPSYHPLVTLAGGIPKSVLMVKKGGQFRIEAENILHSISPKSKILILNTPHNPTGRVLTREEIETVCAIAREKGLTVLSDECYKQALYNGNQHHSIAHFPGMQERTIIVYSFSKAYTMYGWRVGYAVANEHVIRRMVRIQSNSVSCPTSFAQKGALAAVLNGETHVRESMVRYRKLRDMTVEKLNTIDGVSYETPEGGFWVFVDVSRIIKPSDPLVEYLLEKYRIGVTPGSAFGKKGLNHFRIWYLHEEEYLKKGLDGLKVAIERYAKSM